MPSFDCDEREPIPLPQDKFLTPGLLASTGVSDALGSGRVGLVAGSTEAGGSAILQAFMRRWFQAISLGILAAAVVIGIVWFAIPAKYVAEAKVQFAPHPPRGMFVSESHLESREEFEAYQRTQTIFAKSRAVLNSTISSSKLQNVEELSRQIDPVAWLDKSLTVDTTLGPEVMRLSLSGERASDLALILNELTRFYLEEVARKEKASRALLLDQLQESVRAGRDTLRRARSELAGLEIAVGARDPDSIKLNYQSALQQLHATQAFGLTAKLELQDAENELATLKAHEKLPPRIKISESALEEFLKTDPRAMRYYSELAKIDDQIATIKKTANSDAWPQYLKGPLQERSEIESAFAVLRKELLPKSEAQLRAKAMDDLRDSLIKQQTRVASLQQRTRTLEHEIKTQSEIVEKLNRAIHQPDNPTSDLEVMRHDVALKEATLRKAAEQLELMRIEPKAASRVTLLESADPPTTKNYLMQIRIGGATAFAAFGLVASLAIFREFRTRRIYAAADVTRLGLKLVGTLPTVPEEAQHFLAAQDHGSNAYWQNLLAESVDAIRSQLLHSADSNGLRIVMVTSSSGGEGKTSLATHLATSLARAWRKTLLLDGDIRNPEAHKQFKVSCDPGLCEVLRGESELDDVILPTMVSRLWIVPAGQYDAHAIQALAQKEVRSLFARLRDQFDFIVVDSSPVLPVADALSLGQHVDGVIFSILRDVSRLPAVQEAHQRLSRLGIPILGSVVIGATGNASSDSYQYPLKLINQ